MSITQTELRATDRPSRPSGSDAGSNTHLLCEPIGRPWQDELIWLPLAGPRPARVVRAADGQVLPSQISEGRIGVRVNLAANERLELRIEPGVPGRVDNPFTIQSDAAVAVIANGVIAVRVPASGVFTPGEVPGPILALQRDGAWLGAGSWGPAAFMGRIETTILDRGPLWARWLTRYLIDGQEFARYDCTLYAGEDFVRVRDETRRDAGLAFRFQLAGGKATEWFTHGGGEHTAIARGPLSHLPARKGPPRPNELFHIDFNSGHFQMSYTWVGLILETGTTVGVTELNGGHWQIPGRNRIRLLDRAGDLEFVFPANGGSKEFALVYGRAEVYAPASGLSQFCHLRRKWSDVPLEKVRHWVTEWPLVTPAQPILYPAGTVDHWPERLRAWPELDAAYRRVAQAVPGWTAGLPGYLLTDDAALREELLTWCERALSRGVADVLENGYLRLNIVTGRFVKLAVEVFDILRSGGEFSGDRAQAAARRLAFLAYCFADPNYWPWDSAFRDRGDPRSLGADYADDIGMSLCPPNFTSEYYTAFAMIGLTYPEHPAAADWVARGEDLFARNLAFQFYESGAYGESLNYHAHELCMLTQLALALLAAGHRDFFEHPRFKATFGFFVDLLTPPVALTDAGRGLATGPQCLHPPADGERVVLLPNWGNSGHDCSGDLVPATVAVAAGIYATRDPAYARRLMTAWRRSPQQFSTYYTPLALGACGRPDLAEIELGLGSKLLEGLGAVMRAGETFAWIKCGTATNHNCRDEGGLVLYAYGAPVIGDFGYHTRHEQRQEGGAETWKHTCVSFGGRTMSAYLGTEIAQPPKHWESTPAYDRLVADLPVEFLIPEGAGYLQIERVPRIEHQRSILFVKPHFFVIYDQIPQTTLPSTWWLHALADAVEITPQRARFQGRFGVDLDVQVLLPERAQLAQGIYSVQRHIRIDQPGAGNYLVVLTPLRRGRDEAPRASFDPGSRVLAVTGEWGTHRIAVAAGSAPGLTLQ